MRTGTGIVLASAGLALALAGCDTLDGRYLREGVGTELYTADALDGARLQELYVGYICQQAGLAFTASGDVLICREAPVSPNWAIFVQAGLNDIDRRCDAYLAWLDNRRRWIGPIHQQILDTQTATIAILAATLVDPTKAIAVVGAAFGFASHAFTNFNSRFLFEVEKSTVQSVVLTRQQNFRNTLPIVINNRPAAIYALRQYLRLCMPMTIETQINTTVKLFERGGLPALAESADRPMIDARTVRSAVIRSASAPISRPVQQQPLPPAPDRLNRTERSLRPGEIEGYQRFVCVDVDGSLGPRGSPTRTRLRDHLIKLQEKPESEDDTLTFRDKRILDREIRQGRSGC